MVGAIGVLGADKAKHFVRFYTNAQAAIADVESIAICQPDCEAWLKEVYEQLIDLLDVMAFEGDEIEKMTSPAPMQRIKEWVNLVPC